MVFIAAEGGSGIHDRIWALMEHYGLDDFPLAVIPCPVDLASKNNDAKKILTLIHEAEERHGQKVKLIVVDTASRALAGGDENSSVDMGSLVKVCDSLRTAANATLMLVHHSGKDKARGARGHSLLRAATDTEIEIGNNEIKVTKQRHTEPMKTVGFLLKTVLLGKDADGDPRTSGIIDLVTASEFAKIDLTEDERPSFEALKNVSSMKEGDNPLVTGEEWLTEIAHLVGPGEGKTQEDFPAKISARSVSVYIGEHHAKCSTWMKVTRQKGWVQEVQTNQYVIAK